MFHILANLDQEERWLGRTLPAHVKRRVTAMSTLLQVFAPEGDDVTLHGLVALGAGEFETPRWRCPTIVATPPDHADLVWCDRDARRFNDRRFALALATELGCALPGARAVTSVGEVEAHLHTLPADGAWVCKAPWASAGRHRVHGRGRTLARDHRIALERLIQRAGAVVFEPWLERIADVAICGSVGDRVALEPPHTLMTSPRGTFVGIRVLATALEVVEHDQFLLTAERIAHALAAAGYRGPFGIDAFVYRDGNERRLHPLCEINARYTFGHVAHALARRFMGTWLGFGPVVPPASYPLVVGPGIKAWIG